VHRDLKPENLLLAVKDSDDCIKLADFGFATKVSSNNLTALCGTPGKILKFKCICC
jgi:serine/threonine protein kinase